MMYFRTHHHLELCCTKSYQENKRGRDVGEGSPSSWHTAHTHQPHHSNLTKLIISVPVAYTGHVAALNLFGAVFPGDLNTPPFAPE